VGAGPPEILDPVNRRKAPVTPLHTPTTSPDIVAPPSDRRVKWPIQLSPSKIVAAGTSKFRSASIEPVYAWPNVVKLTFDPLWTTFAFNRNTSSGSS
jgi:hypothetical protein